MKKQYKVTVYVMSPYSTIVKAKNEKKAINKALNREGPAHLMHYEEVKEDEWTPDALDEFPNLGKNEQPEVEEL